MDTIVLDGEAGRIFSRNADCAEDFDLAPGQLGEPGDVMVIKGDGLLEPCSAAYDRRVAGILSGAGKEKPGIVLGRRDMQEPGSDRRPLALVGRVYCRVDTGFGAVQVGDLLTTSPTRGHAMKTADSARSPGAVIGKALAALNEGRGLIPVLVTLQ